MKKSWLTVVAALAGAMSLGAAEVLLEEDFAFASPGKTMPKGFTYFYGSKLPKGTPAKVNAEVRKYQDGCEIVFDDQCGQTGIGLGYQFDAEPGAVYRATATGAVLPGRHTKNVQVQLAIGKNRKSVPLNAPADGSEVTRQVEVEAPAGVTTASFHFYSVYDGDPGFIVRSVKIERIKDYLMSSMTAAGESKVETARIEIAVRNCPPAVRVVDESKIADKFYREKVTRDLSLTDIKNAIKAGEIVEGAILETKRSVLIK